MRILSFGFVFWLGACSRYVPHAVLDTRPATLVPTEDVAIYVTFGRTASHTTAGFSMGTTEWQREEDACEVFAEIDAYRHGLHREVRASIAYDFSGSVRFDACAHALSSARVESCARGTRSVIVLGVERFAVVAYGTSLFITKLTEREGTCEQTLAGLADAAKLVELSHQEGACDALLRAGELDLGTHCMIDFHSTLDTRPYPRDLEAAIEATIAGRSTRSELVRWAAGIAAGASGPIDLEAALYRRLLETRPGDDRVGWDPYRMQLGIAYAPSLARRRAYIAEGIAMCRNGHLFQVDQRAALDHAVKALGDDALHQSLVVACGVSLHDWSVTSDFHAHLNAL